MTDLFGSVGAWIASLGIVGAAAVTIAYFMFKLFSEKWLNSKFEERLAAYRHEQVKELEQLRFKINGLMDRTTKLHQREFEVLPEAWSKIVNAHHVVDNCISALQSYPDLTRMTPAQYNEFLERCSLPNWQRDELRGIEGEPRNKYYQSAYNRKRGGDAREAYRDFFVFFRQKGIFVREEIKEKFEELSDLIYANLVEYEHSIDERLTVAEWKQRGEAAKECTSKLKELERTIQGRLWDATTAAA